jgi:tripartite-type tricarboxylate transporter receptor subunit TctC
MPLPPTLARRALIVAALAAGATRGGRAAATPPFPARGVRLVVPYSAGIGPDVVARAVAAQLARAWGQPVLVENKPGASGIVAFGDVRQVAPDGHTLFLADTATLAVNPLLHATPTCGPCSRPRARSPTTFAMARSATATRAT